VERTRINVPIWDELGKALVDPAAPPAADILVIFFSWGQSQPAIGIKTFDTHTHRSNHSTFSSSLRNLLVAIFR
jgi:hypothetical protein